MEDREKTILDITAMSKRMRLQALKMGFSAGSIGAHFGSALSIIELTATLYGAIMKINPQNPCSHDRDRFILSKGHGALGYYTALAEVGFLSPEELATFDKNDGILPGQPQMNLPKGIEFSGGSLGLGLSLGIGIALASRKSGQHYNTYVLMGDGECNEGSVWEAAIAASYYKLDNLVAIIDRNNFQSDGNCSDIMCMGNMADKWRSFGWETVEIDGHNVREIYDAFSAERTTGKPYAVIAKTIKGKGISFMENNKDWHHNILTQTLFETATAELAQ